jgi:enoyl-CoA hydratase
MTEKHHPGIRIEQRGRVLLARLDGGPRGELGPAIAADLDALVTRAETDEEVGAVVLTGTHPERFVAHADVRWLQEGGAASPSVGPRTGSAIVHAASTARRVPGVRPVFARTPLGGAMELDRLHKTLLRMNRCGAVFVAALNGSALGIGSELALACDYRLMAAGDHVIGQPEILLGFPPGGGGTQRLARLVGVAHAKDLVLTARRVGAAEALSMGLVTQLAPPQRILPDALALAERVARNAPVSLRQAKRAIDGGFHLPLEEALDLENRLYQDCMGTKDRTEALRAFAEKRPPVFTGE